jgi:hypothetical protein
MSFRLPDRREARVVFTGLKMARKLSRRVPFQGGIPLRSVQTSCWARLMACATPVPKYQTVVRSGTHHSRLLNTVDHQWPPSRLTECSQAITRGREKPLARRNRRGRALTE